MVEERSVHPLSTRLSRTHSFPFARRVQLSIKAPRGIQGYILEPQEVNNFSSCRSTLSSLLSSLADSFRWFPLAGKVQGNFGGSSKFPDKTRGGESICFPLSSSQSLPLTAISPLFHSLQRRRPFRRASWLALGSFVFLPLTRLFRRLIHVLPAWIR